MSESECKWAYDENSDYWETGCGQAWCLLEGTPEENHMKFCPFCGQLLRSEGVGYSECRL